MVVELDHHHRALDAVVERVVFTGAADPAKVGVAEVAFDFLDARSARTFGQWLDVGVDEIEQVLFLNRGEARDRRAFVWHHAVVLECAAQMQLVGTVASRRWHVAAGGGMEQDRLLALRVR